MASILSPEQNHPLVDAARSGNAEQVRAWMAEEDSKQYYAQALRWAAHNGHTECVKELFAYCSSHVCASALNAAAEEGHAECVRLLIPVSPSNRHQAIMALTLAVNKRHKTCVELLLSHADPKGYKSWPLQKAVFNENEECALLLWPHSDVKEALDALCTSHPVHSNKFRGFVQKIEANIQKQELQKVVAETPPHRLALRKI